MIPMALSAWLAVSPASAADSPQSPHSGISTAPTDSGTLGNPLARPLSAGFDSGASARPGAEALLSDSKVSSDPLLPEILSPGEKWMWGEQGFMRKHGGFPLTEEGREREMELRRTMLTAHQIGGFITLGAMIATAYCGQMIINGNEGYEDAKGVLAWTTVGAYFTTAALSLMSPPPMIRRKEWSTISTHKALAWVHFTGMILTPILGTMVEDAGTVRTIHQVSGYATTAAFAGAMYVVTF
jgi:hypothetical protein